MSRKLALGLLGPLSFCSVCVAQSVLHAGTTLSVDSGTTLSVPEIALYIEPAAVLVNDGRIDLAPLAILDEPPGWPVRGAGTEHILHGYGGLTVNAEPGGLGFTFTTAIAAGWVDLVRGHTSFTDTMGRVSLLRWYQASASVPDLDAIVRCTYDTTELNGIPEGNLQLFLRQGGDSLWHPLPSGLNMVQKEATVDLQDSLGTYAFFDGTIATVVHEEPFVSSTTLEVFPSPATSFLEVRSTVAPLRWVEIVDASGKVIARVALGFATSAMRIDVHALRPGLYSLRTDDGRSIRFIRS